MKRDRNKDAIKGLELIKQFIEGYPKSQYPSVDDDLLVKFTKGAKLLGINYIVTPNDDDKCPDCGYVSGKIGKKGISLHTSFGINTMCLYCSCESEYKTMMENDHFAHCDHPMEELEMNGIRQWSRQDCEHMWEDFVDYYNRVLKELES